MAKHDAHKILNPDIPVVHCDYCGEEAMLKDDTFVYRGRSYGGKVWVCQCQPGWSWVGCHKHGEGNKPLGRLANKELRQWKIKAHEYFDPIWKENNKRYARKKAYQWLSRKMDIPFSECHIGMFDVDQCKKAVELCKARLEELRSERGI